MGEDNYYKVKDKKYVGDGTLVLTKQEECSLLQHLMKICLLQPNVVVLVLLVVNY